MLYDFSVVYVILFKTNIRCLTSKINNIQGENMGPPMVVASPIGSTAESPLKTDMVYAAHGHGRTPNYSRPNQRYEEGGALKFTGSPLGRRMYGEGLLKDVIDLTSRLYQRGSSAIAVGEDDSAVSGNYFGLQRTKYYSFKDLGLYR